MKICKSRSKTLLVTVRNVGQKFDGDTELLLILTSKNCIFYVKSLFLHPIISSVCFSKKNMYFHVLI